jgi:Arc/MetJ-type ribon-helix-helix transcriptional regulator
MTITYPPELDEFVKLELARGAFGSEEELVINAVSALREMKLRHEQLRGDVQAAIEQADRGEVAPLDMDAIKRELMDEIDELGQPL